MMFKPGSIRKIIVKDFVTYREVDMYPRPHLNMIVGPNGTGKSTIVAAIILGLGGSPKTVGRGTKISEYVRHTCEEATIHIFLQGDMEDEYIQITRNINIEDRSIWLLNGKKVAFKEIENITKKFNIQVDNLCQFLPQDRVQDFAKMNKQELLQQTQIALCRSDLIEMQLKLIEYRQKHKDYLASVEKSGQRLQELHDANLRIEERVKNLTKKKKYTKAIEDVDRKLAWIKYENVKIQLDEIKVDREQATTVYNRQKHAAKPIEKAIANASKTISNIERKVENSAKIVREKETKVRFIIEKCGGLKSKLSDASSELKTRLLEIGRRDQEISEISNQIGQLMENKRDVLATQGDEGEREAKIQQNNEKVKEVVVQINKLIEKKGSLENKKQNRKYELRAFENEIRKLENVKHQRLDWLARMDGDAHAAVQWFRLNKGTFKGEVFEPIMLELNVLNPKHAIFIENTISVRDRIAFTCVDKQDMNTLIRVLRDEKNLKVNVVHSGNDQPPLANYQPSIPVEQLKRYGLFAYINSLVTGPEPIMKYLCKTYRIHNTPVGTNITNKQFEHVPPEVTSFFSDNYRFSTTYSKYTGEKSTRQSEIKSDGSFSICIDLERLEKLKGQMAEGEDDCKRLDEETKNLNAQIGQWNEKSAVIKQTILQLQKSKNDIQTIDSRLRVLNNKLQQMQKDTTSKDQVEQEYNAQIKNTVQKMIAIQTEIKQAFEIYSNLQTQNDLDKTNLETSRKQVNFLENKAEEIRHICREAEKTLQKINETYTAIKNDAKTCLANAKKLSDGLTPDDDGFEQFRAAYDLLSNNLEELQAEKEHLLSKIDCLNTADLGELHEYESRKEAILNIQSNMGEENTQLECLNSKMDDLQAKWLEPLQELVEQISEKFSDAFRRMGCAGDVGISKGDNERDFAEYGLSIKVKYRDSEPLQELNSTVQSGGERAVATAVFMLSLQDLTPVPFRCVDEINQGMDAINERRIIELLFESTSRLENPQYFFITPKLLPNLNYVKNMTVHFVFNGPYVITPPLRDAADFTRRSMFRE